MEKNNDCTWKIVDFGSMGHVDLCYKTSCGKEYDCDKVQKDNFCQNCGKKIV